MTTYYTPANTQDDLLLQNLMNFYENAANMLTIRAIVNGESQVSLRIIDWFVTNYAKKYETEYVIQMRTGILKDLIEDCVFKVYHRYKLQLKAYSKKRFDPFCRWDRISIPCGDECFMETTIGQLNFFKWAIENRILNHIENHYEDIEKDMNSRNSSSRRNTTSSTENSDTSAEETITASAATATTKSDGKTRKKRQELSSTSSKCIKKEMVKIVVAFDR